MESDAVDRIRSHHTARYPDLDTRAFGVTGRVLRLAQFFESKRAEHLAAFDLTSGDFDVLATIRRTQGSDGVNPGQVLQSVLITSGGLTKRLDRLESAGLIRRQPDPSDRRATLLRLTESGAELVDRVIPSLLTMEHGFVSSVLSRTQVDQASSLLRMLTTESEREHHS